MKKLNILPDILNSIILIVVGIVLVARPTIIGETICYIIGGAALVIGLGFFFGGLRGDTYTYVVEVGKVVKSNTVSKGAAYILFGIFIMIKSELFIALLPFILGFLLAVNAFRSIESAMELRKMDSSRFKSSFISSMGVLIFGIIIMINPFSTAKIMFIIIGLGLIISGAIGIWIEISVDKKMKDITLDT